MNSHFRLGHLGRTGRAGRASVRLWTCLRPFNPLKIWSFVPTFGHTEFVVEISHINHKFGWAEFRTFILSFAYLEMYIINPSENNSETCEFSTCISYAELFKFSTQINLPENLLDTLYFYPNFDQTKMFHFGPDFGKAEIRDECFYFRQYIR